MCDNNNIDKKFDRVWQTIQANTELYNSVLALVQEHSKTQALLQKDVQSLCEALKEFTHYGNPRCAERGVTLKIHGDEIGYLKKWIYGLTSGVAIGLIVALTTAAIKMGG